jgi:signal transduction histidine kinase
MFAAAVIVTALALVMSAYFITRSAQRADALDKGLTQSRFNLFLADSLLPEDPTSNDYSYILQALQIRGDFLTIIETPEETYVSGPQVDRSLISSELAHTVAAGRLGYQEVRLAGEPTLAVGGQMRSDLTLYFFYPQGDRLADLTRLRNTLVTGGAILAVLGAIAGYVLSRRLVAPIRTAGQAAERMSRGDLDIRLQEGTDEFGQLAGSFNRMAENLQTKMAALEAGQARERRFVADVTHELRTPVSALVGEASLLKSRLETTPGACPPEITHLAVLVSTDIGRLRQLVDDLLEISRLDAQAAETTFEWVDIADFSRRLIEAHGWSGAVGLSSDTGSGPPHVLQTDKRRLERILVNLIDNALHHGAPPVQVELHQRVVGPGTTFLDIIITDSGQGIAPADLVHVFDRFYKADPSRSSSRGSGLGLAIARANAHLLGGGLAATNAPQGGARFVLTLPAGGSPAENAPPAYS